MIEPGSLVLAVLAALQTPAPPAHPPEPPRFQNADRQHSVAPDPRAVQEAQAWADTLAARLGDRNRDIAHSAHAGLVALGPDAEPALRRVAEAGDPDSARSAARALDEIRVRIEFGPRPPFPPFSFGPPPFARPPALRDDGPIRARRDERGEPGERGGPPWSGTPRTGPPPPPRIDAPSTESRDSRGPRRARPPQDEWQGDAQRGWHRPRDVPPFPRPGQGPDRDPRDRRGPPPRDGRGPRADGPGAPPPRGPDDPDHEPSERRPPRAGPI
jgi:hypothetical protein